MAAANQSSSNQPPDLIAPLWHTAVLLLLLLAVAGFSAWGGSRLVAGGAGPYFRTGNYTIVLVWEWLCVAFIAWGMRRRNRRLGELVRGGWPTPGAFLRDLGLAFLLLFGTATIVATIQYVLHNRPNLAVRSLLPETPLEVVLWIVLSATAGFCEEAIFRGYLQRQLGALLRSSMAGVVLQGILFGTCHGYQGVKSMAALSVFGCIFGLAAERLQSLRPCMLAHFIQDCAGGLLLREALKRVPEMVR